jgi:hypothetical protein
MELALSREKIVKHTSSKIVFSLEDSDIKGLEERIKSYWNARQADIKDGEFCRWWLIINRD